MPAWDQGRYMREFIPTPRTSKLLKELAARRDEEEPGWNTGPVTGDSYDQVQLICLCMQLERELFDAECRLLVALSKPGSADE
jgi:hypothetical protein